jgi:hypothetical protein
VAGAILEGCRKQSAAQRIAHCGGIADHAGREASSVERVIDERSQCVL